MKDKQKSYQFARLRFYAPIGVSNVQLRGETISGKFTSEPFPYYGERGNALAQKFATWNTAPSRIVQFTQRYGPLSGNVLAGKDFQFDVRSWVLSQSSFLQIWRQVTSGAIDPAWTELELPGGNTWTFKDGWLELRCFDLYSFLLLQLITQDKQVRICERPDCLTPYFIANHGKERYCSTNCGNWSQAQLKKRWHEEQRAKRISDKKQPMKRGNK